MRISKKEARICLAAFERVLSAVTDLEERGKWSEKILPLARKFGRMLKTKRERKSEGRDRTRRGINASVLRLPDAAKETR
jgi:hypothetical protein